MAYDLEGMQKTVSAAKSGGMYWKPPQGKTKIRILPGTVGNCDPGTFFAEINTHNIKVGEKFLKINAAPPGTWSPIDACIKIFREHGMNDQAKNLAARKSYAMNIVVNGESEVRTWQCSATQVEKLLGFLTDEDWGDFTSPKNGFCIAVTRTGEGLKTRYDVNASNTKGKLPENWQDAAHDLRAVAGGEDIPYKDLIGMLAEKYEDEYEGLASELISSRKRALRGTEDRVKKKKRKEK